MNSTIIKRFEEQNAPLAALLRELAGQRLMLFVNPGNAGDSMIAAATYQIFRHYGITFDVPALDRAGSLHGETVVLGGGGNLVPLYEHAAGVLRELPRDNRIIVLPHSILGHAPVLRALPDDAVLFCREMQAFQYARAHAPQCTVRIGHDLGLYLDIELLAAELEGSNVRQKFAAYLAQHGRTTPEQVTGKRLNCMRRGMEATFVPKGPNYDISTFFRTGVGRGKAELGAWMMIEFTRLASHITTNRLHIGVASAIAGTPTVLHDNSYGKVSTVYEHSMQDVFPHVSFEGEANVAAFA